MNAKIKTLAEAYRQVQSKRTEYDGDPTCDYALAGAALELADAVVALLEDQPMEEPGLVRPLRVELVDLVAGARQLYGDNAEEVIGRPLPPVDYRFILVGQSARTTIHAGAKVTAEFLVQYEEARMAERGLQLCGCLINDGGAHRVHCPSHPEGVKGSRL
jgi:hypothetical protein